MQQSATLVLVNDRHSKQYKVEMEAKGVHGLFVVNTYYGAIGSVQTFRTKTPQPVTVEVALKQYNKLLAEKTGKPCSCCGATYQASEELQIDSRASATVATADVEDGATLENYKFSPELLEAMTVEESGRIINSGMYGCMKKYDGHRQAVRKVGGLVQAYNRLGKLIDPDPNVVRFVGSLVDDVVLDGEFVEGHFVAFDLLELNGQDMRSMEFEARWDVLTTVCGNKVLVAPLAVGKADIMRLIQAEHDTRGEGVVFKKLSARYMPGRQGTNRKLKFWTSATLRICPKQKTAKAAQAHSFGVEAHTPGSPLGEWGYVGSVTCKGPMPEAGTFREVKYLYVGAGGHLYQPEDWGAREDVTAADCAYSSLKQKQAKEDAR